MTIQDSLTVLDVLYDVQVALAPDGAHLHVTGNPHAIALATPKILLLKPAILDHLRTTRPT